MYAFKSASLSLGIKYNIGASCNRRPSQAAATTCPAPVDASVVFMARIQLTNLVEDVLPRDFLMRLPPPTLNHQPVRNDHFSFSDDVEHGFNSLTP